MAKLVLEYRGPQPPKKPLFKPWHERPEFWSKALSLAGSVLAIAALLLVGTGADLDPYAVLAVLPAWLMGAAFNVAGMLVEVCRKGRWSPAALMLNVTTWLLLAAGVLAFADRIG